MLSNKSSTIGYKIVKIYQAVPDTGIRYRELANNLHPMSNSTIVKGLRYLEYIGVVERQGVKSKRGKGVKYYKNPLSFTNIMSLALVSSIPFFINMIDKNEESAIQKHLEVINVNIKNALLESEGEYYDVALEFVIFPHLKDLKNLIRSINKIPEDRIVIPPPAEFIDESFSPQP